MKRSSSREDLVESGADHACADGRRGTGVRGHLAMTAVAEPERNAPSPGSARRPARRASFAAGVVGDWRAATIAVPAGTVTSGVVGRRCGHGGGHASARGSACERMAPVITRRRTVPR
jgi:hypothetical protein